MITCSFSAKALDVMAERGISEEELSAAAATALANRTYIYNDEHCIFRGRAGSITVYGVFTHGGAGGALPEGADSIEISSAYSHRIIFVEEAQS